MRALALPLLVLPTIAFADRVVTVPAGKKLTLGTARFEAMWEFGEPRMNRYYLGAGVTDHLEVELFSDRLDQSRRFDSFDIAWNQSAPITDLAPGINFGVLDVLDKTPEGTRIFGAVTFRVGLEGETVNDVPMEITLGAQSHRRRAIFVGAIVPFSNRLRWLAEHDGERITAGAEIRPVPGLALRFLVRENRPLGSVSLTHRF